MVIAILQVNGVIHVAEGEKEEVKKKIRGWLDEAKKNFPNKEFLPRFYRGRRIQLETEIEKLAA